MLLPFSRDQFLDVFGAYNERFWPIVVALWLATLVGCLLLARNRPNCERFITVLLIVHWTWVALAYHAAFFSKINPAAWFFSVIFLMHAGFLAWHGMVRNRLRFSFKRSLRHRISLLFLVYALVYPAVALAEGNDLPRSPTFGVPCPTTILTIGLLLATERCPPIALLLVPTLWAFIGGSAAFLLAVRTDLLLPVAGLTLLIYAVSCRNHKSLPS